jgi:GNAT superfamily N-acetyltransferase
LRSYETLDRYRAGIADQNNCFTGYVAVKEGTIIGVVFASGGPSGVMELHHLAVVDGERGQGIGKALVGKVIAENPDQAISLSVALADNEAEPREKVARFWRTLGFESDRAARMTIDL